MKTMTTHAEHPVEPRPGNSAGRVVAAKAFDIERWKTVLPAATAVLGLVIWELIARTSSSPLFVPLGDIYQAGADMVASGELREHLMASGLSFVIGYFSAVIVGVIFGIIFGISRVLEITVVPWMYAFYSIPIVALAPIFILAFGIGLAGHVAVVFMITVFAIVINTTAGIKTADKQYIDVVFAYQASRLEIIRYVLLPTAVPFVLTGMRLGVTRALIGVVVAEMFGSRAGIGHMVVQAQDTFNTPVMYVGVVILGVFGIACTSGLGWWERRLDKWRPKS